MAQASARLFKLQSEAANAAFAENSEHLTTLLSTLNATDSAALLAEWTRLYQANVGRLLDISRRCFDIVPQTQNELANIVRDPFASANKQTQLYVIFASAVGGRVRMLRQTRYERSLPPCMSS
jgi:phasin family protein